MVFLIYELKNAPYKGCIFYYVPRETFSIKKILTKIKLFSKYKYLIFVSSIKRQAAYKIAEGIRSSLS